jgi:hypothetical protein
MRSISARTRNRARNFDVRRLTQRARHCEIENRPSHSTASGREVPIQSRAPGPAAPVERGLRCGGTGSSESCVIRIEVSDGVTALLRERAGDVETSPLFLRRRDRSLGPKTVRTWRARQGAASSAARPGGPEAGLRRAPSGLGVLAADCFGVALRRSVDRQLPHGSAFHEAVSIGGSRRALRRPKGRQARRQRCDLAPARLRAQAGPSSRPELSGLARHTRGTHFPVARGEIQQVPPQLAEHLDTRAAS